MNDSETSPKPTGADDPETTHFGYQTIPTADKTGKVSAVFDLVASKYDLMNDLMSLGIHRLWKRFTIRLGQLRPGHQVLDLAGGSGDLTEKISPLVGPAGGVILADINRRMLEVGRDRLLDSGLIANVSLAQVNAESLPFPDNFFDRIFIGFGLRNVTHKERALASIYRCLRPGGFVLILEFSRPTTAALARLYDAYSFHLLPKIGKWVANDEASYQYLAESIRMHPDQETLATMMGDLGYDQCDYHNLSGGIVAVHRGYKY